MVPCKADNDRTITINATDVTRRVGFAAGMILLVAISVPIIIALMLLYGGAIYHIACAVIGVDPAARTGNEGPVFLAVFGTIATFAVSAIAITAAICMD